MDAKAKIYVDFLPIEAPQNLFNFVVKEIPLSCGFPTRKPVA